MQIRFTTLGAAAFLAAAQLANAAPAADSAYRTDKQQTRVEDATSRGIKQVNMITCIMAAMRPDTMVNLGNYIALVDENKCNDDARSSSSNSSSTNAGSSAPSYMNATVNSTRTTNADPMRVLTWIDMAQEGFASTIFVNTSATQAPSASNPYGVFRLDFCGRAATGPCMMRGFLDASATGMSYFEIESGGGGGGGGGGSTTKALRLITSGTDSGSGMLRIDEGGTPIAYSFAYDAQYFRRSDGTTDQCFSRDATDADTGMSVWRYGLYDASTGAQVTRRSGFPIEYSTGGRTYNGHIGYWGLWLPTDVASSVVTGTTVQKVDFVEGQEPTKTPYTVVKSEGRLTKYTKQTRTLAAIDKLKFNTFIFDVTGFYAGAVANRQYEMYWDDSAGAFKVSGVVECTSSRCETQTLDIERTVSVDYFATHGGVQGWSQSLGGELSIPLAGVSGPIVSASVNVVYRAADLVYPSQMPASLHCLRECPTAATMAGYFAQGATVPSPFVASTYNNWGPTASAAVVNYTTDTSLGLLRDASSASVVFTDSAALQQRPQYQSGVRSGRLFVNLSDVTCDNDPSRYCDHKLGGLDTYYQWETGPNQWNQFAAVKDSSGAFVAFEAPLQVTYNVPAGAHYGQYAGKSIVLQYGGFGELWGIPGRCVDRHTNEATSCDTPESRYVPSFVIPFDETLGRVVAGSTPMLAKWLDREIRFARKPASVCAAAGVNLPTGLTLPTATELRDPSDSTSSIYIGTKPEVTATPRVIHGQVMY